MSERIEAMERFIEQYPDNPFPRYALAIEYRLAGRAQEAEDTLRALLARAPDYAAAWQQLGMLHEDAGRAGEAKDAYAKGVAAARAAGNGHAADEMQAALDRLE